MREATGCWRLVGLRGSGWLLGVKNREVIGCGFFFEIMKKKKFLRQNFEIFLGGYRFWEAIFFGRLVGAGGYWVWEASGCGRLLGAGG